MTHIDEKQQTDELQPKPEQTATEPQQQVKVKKPRKISFNRVLVAILVGVGFISTVLLGEFIDRWITAVILAIIIGICVMETRRAFGTRLPKQFNPLIWMYAIGFCVPYYLFGYVGIVLFSLLTFVVGVVIVIINNMTPKVLQIYAFILVYPALLLSTLMYINRSESSYIRSAGDPGYESLVTTNLWSKIWGLGDNVQLLPFNTVGLALVFMVSCLSDMFAQLIGIAFGKHKLCPDISPNKTVEGAIGGLFGGLLGAGIVFLLFEGFPLMGMPLFKSGLPVKLWLKIIDYVLIGIVGSACTQVGDLLASIVKRECGIKDYSHLLGSHGGFMDRFDGIMLNSVFVAVVFAFIL